MVKDYIIVSMYTIDTPYQQEIKILEKSIEQFKLNYKLYPIVSCGNWAKNTQKKAEVIFTAMHEFPKRNIVWLDADAILLNKPKFFEDVQGDFSCVIFSPNQRKNPHKRNLLLSGTMFIRNNMIMKDIIRKWIALNHTNEEWDQANLYDLYCKFKFKHVQLPREYCKVRPSTDKDKEEVIPTGVVWHNQRSRKVRANQWKI